jgi:hypothetical protein
MFDPANSCVTPPLDAYDALIAFDIEPVIPLVTVNEPVIVESLREISPFLAINSFGMIVY